jgi:CRISPR-associated protein Csm2
MENYWKKPILKEWIKEKITNDGTVAWAEKFGNHLASKNCPVLENGSIKYKKDKSGKIIEKNGEKLFLNRKELTTTQLRRFFGEVKRIQAKGFDPKEKVEFILLKPKLAYAVARVKDEHAKIHDFYKVLAPAIDIVETEQDFKRFIQIFEAIVAYHKAAEESKLIIENI